MKHRAWVLASLLVVVAACSPPAPVVAPCDGGCASDQFCCVASCMPLGSVCGASPDAAVDDRAAPGVDAGTDAHAPPPVDAVDAAIDAPYHCVVPTGATSAAQACADHATVVDCATGQATACRASAPTCVAWTDAATHAQRAACLEPGHETVCDPAHDASHCDGTTARYCNAENNAVALGLPPGWWGAIACRPDWAADATCVVMAGVPVCTSPTDVPCDPSTFAATCATRCDEAPRLPMGGVERPASCPSATPQCVMLAAPATGPACLPADAVPSAQPATSTMDYLACVGTGAARVEIDGYEWTMACPDRLQIDVSTGVTSHVPTHCWTSPDHASVQCITAAAVTCASATSAARCTDATHSQACSDWLQYTSQCTLPGGSDGTLAPGVCDPATGACARPPACHAGWPFTPTCVGPDHAWQIGTCTTGEATLAPCAGCHPSADGTNVVCGS